jgi:Holliday junction resolvasome RuvABC endonuclease subunit
MPLIVPEEKFIYRLMSIDPGLNNTGVAIYEINSKLGTINSINVITIITDKVDNKSGLYSDNYSERDIKLYKLKDNIKSLLSYYNPYIVICESPFYSSFRPSAYAALLEVISIIKSSIIEYNINIQFTTIEPLLVKKIVGSGATKGKLDIKSCIENNYLIMSKLIKNINLMNEHEIDALAIGWGFLKTYKLI